MKNSKFNLLIRNGESSLLYNTFTGSISRVSNDLGSFVTVAERERLGSLPTKLLSGLEKQGIIVPNDFDELEEYKKLHELWKAGKEKVEFNVLLTYDCNFECPYCYQGRGEKGQQIHGYRYMSEELFEATKKFIKKTTLERQPKTLELVLYGGEPFLPGAREMGVNLTEDVSKWAQSNGISFKLHVLSNGSLIDQSAVEWMSSFKTRLQIPVDGDPEMHNKYRYDKITKKGSFEDITKVLAMTYGTQIEPHIRISLTDETYPTMENLLDELQKRGLDHVYPDFCYITAFTEACSSFENHTLPDLKLFKIIPELWRKAHKRGFPLDIRPRVQPLPCSSIADGSYIVDPFWEVYKCWELVGLKEHSVGKIDNDGNLNKTSIYGDVLKRNPLEIPACRNHLLLPSCGGGCVCKAQWNSRTYQAPGCGTEKYLLNDKVKVYVETLNSKPETVEEGSLKLQLIEGKQEPQMSHCYVLV